MCKRHTNQLEVAPEPRAYEGQTIRLGTEQHTVVQGRRQCWGGKHWWSMWLIWPLFGVAKWFWPLIIGAFVTLQSIMVPASVLVGLALLMLGLVLLRRSGRERRRFEEYREE